MGIPPIKSLEEMTADEPGSESSEATLRRVRQVVAAAAGWPPLDPHDVPLDVLRKRTRLLYQRALDKSLPSRATSWAERHDPDEVSPDAYDSFDWQTDLSRYARRDKAYAFSSPVTVVPVAWYQHVARTSGSGRGATRRAYFEAIHLLAYITSAYAADGWRGGEALYLHAATIKRRLMITENAYREAIRFLGAEGFVTRITIRGLVPWRPTTRGSYSFAVPRLSKLRACTR